jgi:hypothetical protein
MQILYYVSTMGYLSQNVSKQTSTVSFELVKKLLRFQFLTVASMKMKMLRSVIL